jgi:hypothetical protein
MLHITVFSFFGRVVVEVDDVIEHAHRQRDGFFDLIVIEDFAFDMQAEVDRAEVTDRCLVL